MYKCDAWIWQKKEISKKEFNNLEMQTMRKVCEATFRDQVKNIVLKERNLT